MILEHCRVFSNRTTVTAKSYPLGLPSITEIIRTNLLKYNIVPRYKQSLRSISRSMKIGGDTILRPYLANP